MPTAAELQIDTTASAMDMANAMFGNGIKIVSASYTGASSASGIYSNGTETAPDLTPSDSGVILSTGKATDVTNSSGDVNTSSGTSTSHGTSGDAGLDSISGQTTFDAAILEASFVPEGSVLTMQIVFSSEEYLEYANSGFNDAVGIWVNGVQASLSVGSGDISIDNINDKSNENLYVDNAQTADTYNTEMDGFTVTLTLKAPVKPGEVNTIRIGIADGGDSSYDSNLLIAGESVQTALVVGDDAASIKPGQETELDILSNDHSVNGGTLTITHINGQPVLVGDKITLPSGEIIELTATGVSVVSTNAQAGENAFAYTVEDEFGNTDTGFVTLTTVPCFTAGTLIQTVSGEVPVECLVPGDLVITHDNGPRPVLWIGRSERAASGHSAPIEIAKGVLGARRTTSVSPQHRLLLGNRGASVLFGADEVLTRAIHLENGETIRRRETGSTVLYFHLLFDRHEIIRGDGVLSESFQPGRQTGASFDPSVTQSLRDQMRRHGISRMVSARPSLRKFESVLLFAGLDHRRTLTA